VGDLFMSKCLSVFLWICLCP